MITCVIAGRPVPLIDWSAQVDADWGDRQLTGTLPRFTPLAEQEAPIELWTSTGDRLWSGTLAQDPRHEGDQWSIRALGHAEALAEDRTRLFYRVDGAEAGGWSDKEEDPFEDNNNEKYELTIRPGMVKWKMGSGGQSGADFVGGNQAGFLIWVEGGLITKVKFLNTNGATYGQFELEGMRFTGPAGTKTSEGTFALGAGAVSRTFTLATPQDAFILRMIATGGAVASTLRWSSVSQIKVYGRTTDDDFTASDAAIDVARLTGLATDHVASNGLAVLPLDWTEGHPEFLDYLARLLDWRWMARGDGLHFGPWEQTWVAHTNRDASVQLEPEPRYNRFRVTYDAISGAHREVVASPAVDPFPGREVVSPEEVALEHPQPDAALATAVAAASVEHAAARSVNGPIDLARVRDDKGGVHSPYAACAGDLLSMPDLAPDVGPQRIRSITYRPSHQATAELGDTFSAMHTIAGFRRERKKRRKGRRRVA